MAQACSGMCPHGSHHVDHWVCTAAWCKSSRPAPEKDVHWPAADAVCGGKWWRRPSPRPPPPNRPHRPQVLFGLYETRRTPRCSNRTHHCTTAVYSPGIHAVRNHAQAPNRLPPVVLQASPRRLHQMRHQNGAVYTVHLKPGPRPMPKTGTRTARAVCAIHLRPHAQNRHQKGAVSPCRKQAPTQPVLRNPAAVC